MSDTSTLGKRLRHFRESEAHQSRESFTRGLDITARTLERYENDESTPDATFLGKLNARYNDTLNLDWLLTGRGGVYMNMSAEAAGGAGLREEPEGYRDVILERMQRQLDNVYKEKDFEKLAALQSLLNLISPLED